MRNKTKMYTMVEAREDFIYVDGSDYKFYPHPTLDGIWVSKEARIARAGMTDGIIRLLKTTYQVNGYAKVTYNGRREDATNDLITVCENKLVHRLVLETFVPMPKDGLDYVVDHIDNDKDNNRLLNLQWLTRSDNLKKRDLLGSLLKATFVYDRTTDTVTEYSSRLVAAKATDMQPSNLTNAIKYEQIIRGRYYFTDSDFLLPEDYYYLFKEYDLKQELKAVRVIKRNMIDNKKIVNKDTVSVAKGFKNMNKDVK